MMTWKCSPGSLKESALLRTTPNQYLQYLEVEKQLYSADVMYQIQRQLPRRLAKNMRFPKQGDLLVRVAILLGPTAEPHHAALI
jgi:hypothetical protein